MKRRQFAGNLGAALGALVLGSYTQKSWASAAAAAKPAADPVAGQLRQIEAKSGGRLGVAILDTVTGQSHSYRGDERFPMCSTFKLLAAGLTLHRVDQGREQLARRIRFEKADLVPYSPATEKHAGGDGMSVAELCEATLTLSDNTAANLLLHSFGGPPQLTAYLRSLGDKVTRLDRIEPDLNQATPGDPRDTTSPSAMLSTMQQLLLGNALSADSRKQLTTWLLANKTGDKRLRALLPAGWRVGDKTGSGAYGSTNDIGMLFPPGRAPLLVAAYLTGTKASEATRNATLAEVGRLAASLAAK
ncbi:class A beta-lactamase [Collimonas fungivorans]|uniref:Beta-lactamase n=1 Tax=Collimonas fungivorans (strain Ter331) TaxID=1005048 RepID=G0AJJ5_COLFT|nr:class A beta-lactamase [Collimonas fungivorans]AEK61210.1 Beta-lactamase [Collimonas fungivorans Ter331]